MGDELPNLDDWIERHRGELGLSGSRVLEIGCGPGVDAAAMHGAGLRVVGFDRRADLLREARARVPGGTFVRADIGRAFPFRPGSFDAAIASLSLHYFDWRTTVRSFREVRRVVVEGAPFLFRVNATDDVNFGAGQGEELEPNFYRTSLKQAEACKRFFDRAAVEAAVAGSFAIRRLEHGWISRYGMEKRVWGCLAEAR